MFYGTDLFPTLFSGRIAESVGLIGERPNEDPNVKDESTFFEDVECLRNFQNMVLGGCKYKDAVIAYHGKDLTEIHEDALKVIEKSTKPFVMGELAKHLMNKIQKGDGKSVVDAAEILINEMINPENGKDGISGQRARQLIVQLKR